MNNNVGVMTKKLGRPLGTGKYNKDKIIELGLLMSQGMTDSNICKHWHISRETFYCWIREHEEFKEAYQRGMPANEAAWEEIGRQGMMGQIKGFSFNAWIAFMNRKFGWSKMNANNDSQTQINIGTLNVLSSKSNDQLLEYIQEKAKECNVPLNAEYQIVDDSKTK